jgi:cell fate regulator YaaT (PSP1 superfamily)
MYEVIQIRLRDAGKIEYFSLAGLKPKVDEYVIVEAERGMEYGQAVSEPEILLEADVEAPLRRLIRIATTGDLHQIDRNRKKIAEVTQTCLKKIQDFKLPMKLIEAEYSFDRSKIVFYFTAEGRVDFRELVKDLAGVFKARIELRQIGVRDEAKMLGGFGPCGRVLCCAKFLKDFEPVTIRMAKEQNLPLNPSKISGLCGRLMCCLGYEYNTYREFTKGLPREGDKVRTKDGPGRVINVNVLKREVTAELESGKYVKIDYPRKEKDRK